MISLCLFILPYISLPKRLSRFRLNLVPENLIIR